MSWSGSVSQPNWGGQDNSASGGGASSVGDLYIVPDPTTTEENPSIGLEGRNEVPLPTKYRDLEVKNLTAENINGGSFDVSKWSEFPAIHDVRAELLPLPPIIIGPAPYRRIYDLFDFRNINAGNLYAQFDIANPLGTGQVNGFRGGFNLIDCETIDVSNDNETGTVSIYGSSKLVGTNALYVEGGTTLDGGTIHGTSIGSLPVAGANTIRLDVFPVGMDLISATYITLDSTVGNWATIGALSMSSGGALSLAGGSYIEYNTDENRFINTSSGNDFTDILIGNIHPSYNGSANLRINGGGSGRGVELADTQSINLWTNLPIADWVNSTSYSVGTKVKFGSAWYNCVVINAYTQPDIPIPNWVSASNYIAGTIVFSAGLVYRCSASISGSTTPPNPSSDPNWTNLGFTTNVITQIWSVFNPYVSTINGDEVSVLNIGTIQGPTAGSGLQLNQVKDLNLFTELPIASWVNSTNYATGTKVKYLDLYYNALFPNLNLQPTLPIPAFVDTNSYNVDNIVFQAGEGAFRCIIANGPPSAWTSSEYLVGDRVEFGGLYYECAYTNLAVQPATALPVWASGTTYAENQIVDYSGDTYRASGVPDPLVPPPSVNWILLFIGNNINNIWPPISLDPPNANWELIGSTNAITQVWSPYQPYQSSIDGDRFSSIDAGGMSSNFLTLAGQSYGDAILRFGSSTGSLSTITQNNSTGQIVIDTAVGLTIDTTTNTNFAGGDVVNLKNLTLTSALNPTWNDVVVYPLNAIVEWEGQNWRSEIADNTRNIPSATLQNWDAGGFFPLGSVRYYAPNNKAYICILTIFGSSTPPPSDTTHFAEFQTGNNGEDVFYPVGAVVESTIVGDRLSSIEIGTQEFVCEAGTYLTIGQDISQVGTIDGTILSGGSVNVLGVDGASFGSLNGTASVGGDSVYILTYPTTGGNIQVEANDQLTIGSINDTSLASSTGNVNIATGVGDIILNSADQITLVGVNNVALGSTAGDVSLGSTAGNVIITSTAGDITLTSDGASSISSANSSLTLSSAEATNITSTADAVNLTGFAGVNLTSPDAISLTSSASDVNITAGNDISLDATSNTINFNSNNLTNVGTINGYNPLLTIYKNATIGSAISRAPNTAEIQVYQQTMTLKANTQYNLNVSYSLLTENASTGTPNNNWYIIYRVHGGTSPLTTANLYSAPAIFNSTQIANGVATSFMTGSLTTYTGRFYIRNQNTTVALTVANIQATVIEVV